MYNEIEENYEKNWKDILVLPDGWVYTTDGKPEDPKFIKIY